MNLIIGSRTECSISNLAFYNIVTFALGDTTTAFVYIIGLLPL